MRRLRELKAYLFSVALVALATLLQVLILRVSDGQARPFAAFYAAVAAAGLCGTGPGLLAVALAGFAACFLLDPVGHLHIDGTSNLIALGLFLLAGTFIVFITHQMHRAARSAEVAERLARESEERFRTMADSSPVLMRISDVTGAFTWFNRPLLDFVGHAPDQLRAEGWAQSVHQDDRDRCERTFASHFEQRQPLKMEYRLRRQDGEYRWVLDQCVPMHELAGTFTGYFCSSIDISDRKAAEDWEKLRQAQTAQLNQSLQQEIEDRRAVDLVQARLGAIVESSDDAIVGKTLDGTITSWNQGAQRLFGYTPEEAIGKSILLIVPPERRGEEASILARLARGERIDHFETERVRKDGSWVTVSLTVSPIRDFEGRIVGASKIARDITERKRSEEERERLLEAERAAREHAQYVNRMKDEFLATLSHELRTPLNAILGWAQLLATGNMNPEDARQAVEIIERNARTQKQLIEDLLDMSRIISGKLRLDIQQVWPNSFVEAAIETVIPAAEAKGIEIEKSLDLQAGPVRVDPNRLQQVVWNLLSNAIKFTPSHGNVHVHLGRVNSHIELAVSDNGQGIAPDFLPYVFDRFRQADASTGRRHGGLGLGLAIVKQLVEQHGGSVRVKSPGEGKGATFTVALPVPAVRGFTGLEDDAQMRRASSSNIPDALALEPGARPELSGLKVLVVDDEPDARELIRRLLDECGANVMTAGSAGNALQIIEHEHPDVLVSDIGMPGVDGYELLRRVRTLRQEEGGKVPAVALTAFARTEDRTRALRAGYLAHVAKPVEPSELIATIAAVAGRSGH